MISSKGRIRNLYTNTTESYGISEKLLDIFFLHSFKLKMLIKTNFSYDIWLSKLTRAHYIWSRMI